MEHDVCRFEVSVQDVQACKVLDSFGELANDDPCLLLAKRGTLINQTLQVKAVGILLDHVDVVLGPDGLEVSDAVVAGDHVVDSDLLCDHEHVIVGEEVVVVDFAGEEFFGDVWTRSDELVLVCVFSVAASTLKISESLSLHDSSVLAFAEDLIEEDDVFFDLAHLRLRIARVSHAASERDCSALPAEGTMGWAFNRFNELVSLLHMKILRLL